MSIRAFSSLMIILFEEKPILLPYYNLSFFLFLKKKQNSKANRRHINDGIGAT